MLKPRNAISQRVLTTFAHRADKMSELEYVIMPHDQHMVLRTSFAALVAYAHNSIDAQPQQERLNVLG